MSPDVPENSNSETTPLISNLSLSSTYTSSTTRLGTRSTSPGNAGYLQEQEQEDYVPGSGIDGVALHRDEGDPRHGESYDNVPSEKRQLGLFSAIFLIFNRVIGTGIYATPSVILRTSGSVGVALCMWALGALIAAIGTAVYVELGTGLPRSGGEKNYLEFIYRKPMFLVTCMYSVYAVITGTAAANGIVFGEYVIHALGSEPTRYNTRLVAFLCLTFVLLIHGTLLRWGLRLQNTLGLFKLIILSAIAVCGLLSLAGVKSFAVKEGYDKPKNFDSWEGFWEGSRGDANAFVTGLYNVIWSFVGYSTANYALSEVRDPVKTIKRAAPIAMLSVTVVYMFINIAYFAVVSKEDIIGSKRIIAALFFRNLFGETMERALSIFIALSTLGNLLSGQFSQGRVVQELGREGLLPFSSFFASNKPFNAPLAGLFTQYLISLAFMILPPPGDAYLFMISLSSYCLALINTLVSLGLILLHTSYSPFKSYNWNPPYQAPKLVVGLFFVSNIFLVGVPLVPPGKGKKGYEWLPYWFHPLVAFSVSLIGVAYWFYWARWRPRRYGYEVVRVWVRQEDGVGRWVCVRVPRAENNVM